MDRTLHARIGRNWVGESARQVEIQDFIGSSAAFAAVKHLIAIVAAESVPVLICGETGTGKELCARAIHALSPRAAGPFVPENCGRIPPELIANEFFGHDAGAFSGAIGSTQGLIGQAHGGTLVLDEIDSLPFPAQSIFLRFLQDKTYQRLGGRKSSVADVRIIAVTNADLNDRMEKGLFRRDLYYRLKVFEIVMPPLRERPTDISLLARHFVEKYAEEFHRPVLGVTHDCVAKLRDHDWPGNVRELEDVIQQAVLLSNRSELHGEDLNLPRAASRSLQEAPLSFQAEKAKLLTNFERDYLVRTLSEARGNISLASRIAGMNRGTFWRLLQKHHLLPPQASMPASPVHCSLS